MPATTLVKSIFVDHNSQLLAQPKERFAVDHFGATSAIAQLTATKGFTDPTQADYAALAASQQFLSLVKESSLIGQIEVLGKHKLMPLNTALSSFNLSPCKVITQAMPTEILTESSEIGFNLDFKKIGGYAIFPDRYFTSAYFSKVEPLINEALIDSYVIGENDDFITTITTGATTVTATGTTMPALLTDISSAVNSLGDPQDAIILLNPKTALRIANELELDSLSVNGGSIRGIPVITNIAVSETSKIIFDVTKLVLAADPQIDMRKTSESTVKGATGEDVYLFQQNKIAIQVLGITGYSFMTGHSATVIEG